jgi:hypothetical protein
MPPAALCATWHVAAGSIASRWAPQPQHRSSVQLRHQAHVGHRQILRPPRANTSRPFTVVNSVSPGSIANLCDILAKRTAVSQSVSGGT